MEEEQMATTYHEFDEKEIASALEAAREFYDDETLAMSAEVSTYDDGHLSMSAGCISVAVDNGRICLRLPLGIGRVCVPIPRSIPNGTAAQACLSICTTWRIPTGVRLTIRIAGNTIVRKNFGRC
jgi:hypothetical protein